MHDRPPLVAIILNFQTVCPWVDVNTDNYCVSMRGCQHWQLLCVHAWMSTLTTTVCSWVDVNIDNYCVFMRGCQHWQILCVHEWMSTLTTTQLFPLSLIFFCVNKMCHFFSSHIHWCVAVCGSLRVFGFSCTCALSLSEMCYCQGVLCVGLALYSHDLRPAVSLLDVRHCVAISVVKVKLQSFCESDLYPCSLQTSLWPL